MLGKQYNKLNVAVYHILRLSWPIMLEHSRYTVTSKQVTVIFAVCKQIRLRCNLPSICFFDGCIGNAVRLLVEHGVTSSGCTLFFVTEFM